ncbi:MAG: DUF6513 domain-containing protein, partial [Gemmatimonadales bacterium]
MSTNGSADRLSARPPVRRVLFVTGKLAEPALRKVLKDMQPPFETEIAVMKITVAALMTTPWIARFLEVPPETDLILIPALPPPPHQTHRPRGRIRLNRLPRAPQQRRR